MSSCSKVPDLQETPLSFTIIPEIPTDYISKFYEFMNRLFLTPQKNRFTDISSSSSSVSYSILDSTGKKILNVRMTGSESINVVIEALDPSVSQDELFTSKEDVQIAVDAFEDQVRKNSLFFAWREGESVVPEAVTGK
ncbi:MAG TPA: hypothetical protein VEF91_00985, partial [Verrucomicrobiae bacterium]|nr:hypothetical protein [Verrucomicrobiae bacterium]